MMEYTLAFILSFFLFLSLINFIDTVDFYSPCTNKSLESGIPAVSFCKQSIAASNVAIVLDGYYAHSLTSVTTCTCVARSQVGETLVFGHAIFGSNIGVIPQSCASEIRVSNSNSAGFIMSCKGSGSLTVDDNGQNTVVLRKLQTTSNTRYCLLANLGPESSVNFSITCEGHSTYVTEMPPSVQTTTTQPLPITPQTTTSFSVPSSSIPGDRSQQTSTSGVTSSPNNDKDMLYISVGAGCGAALVIIIIIIIMCKRRGKTKREENRTTSQVDGHDELPYNELYISADAPVSNDQHTNNVNIIMDNTKHDIDGNYSTVDLEDRPQKPKTSINPSKPVIAPKPKSKVNIGKNDHTAAMKSSIKHMTSPGEEGVEYAVVDKKGRVSSAEQDNVTRPPTDNTYAVVNKERKRKSSDSNTNKLKNQMSRSIEVSSDEIRDESRRSSKVTSPKEIHTSQYSGVDQHAPKKNTSTFMISESTNYAEIDLP